MGSNTISSSIESPKSETSAPNTFRAIEVLGCHYCIKTQFILLLAEELNLEVRAQFYPIAYAPRGLIYGEIPAIRELHDPLEDIDNCDTRGPSTTPWVEDFRLIWYHLEGHRLTPDAHATVRNFLDSFFRQPYTAEQIELLKNSSDCLQSKKATVPLTGLQKLYYRYVTWPKFHKRVLAQNSKPSPSVARPASKLLHTDDHLLELHATNHAEPLSLIKLRSLRALELVTNKLKAA